MRYEKRLKKEKGSNDSLKTYFTGFFWGHLF